MGQRQGGKPTPSVRIDWAVLDGLTLQTTTGAKFKVVRVTATYVTVRPEKGHRDYALSIARELEPAVAVFSEAKRLPIPSDLRLLGVRPILTSYAWGILKAVVVDRIGLRTVRRVTLRDFAGVWKITGMSEMGSEYWEDGESEPAMTIRSGSSLAGVSGEYDIGLSSGSIDGDLREFGGEQVVIFGFEGMDEMDQVSGRGWMRWADQDTLEGEFMGVLGPFTAVRGRPATTSKRSPGRRSRGLKRGAPGRGIKLFSG